MENQGYIIAGHEAGRIQPSRWTAPDGSWCFLFGDEEGLVTEDVAVGEESSISQTVDLTDVTLLSFALRFRQTATPGASFEAVVSVMGIDRWTIELPVGEAAQYARRAINVHDVLGDAQVKVTLRRTA